MRAHPADYDVIIIGAGPAGSAAATFLARAGVSTLMLERHRFPRDKVCGDGLTPQALYWLEQLGCVDAVLDQAECCLTECDLYVNGRFVVAGRIPENTPYPPFMTLLDRRRMDEIVARNAVANGATLIEGAHARRIVRQPNGITVEADCAEGRRRFTGRVLIGADGAGSLVSRFLGNSPKNLTKAVSVRGYYEGATADHALARVYFNEGFFPGYGWVFVNDHGHANVGLGYTCDGNFPLRVNLKKQFDAFVAQELADLLGTAAASGPPTGGWAAYCRPAARTAERVVLIGDAGNTGDPLNGAGIHKAFESAALAAGVLPPLLAEDNLSAPAMRRYDEVLESVWGLDMQSADLLLTFAKNPYFRLLYLQLLEHIGSLSQHDQRFAEFASGIFTGMVPRRWYLSPGVLLSAFPRNPRAWLALAAGDQGTHGLSAAAGVTRGLLAGLRNVLNHPAANLAWGLELGAKAMNLGWSMTTDTLTSIGAPLTQAARRQPA